MSEPCARFLRADYELIEFIALSPTLAESIDKARERAVPSLRRWAEYKGDQAKLAELDRPSERVMERVWKLGDIAFEMALTRAADNYLTYLSELLALVFKTRPETLRSGEQVRLDFVLTHASMDELIDALAERRVERLSYAGLVALVEDVRERLNFDLFDSDAELDAAVKVVETRNLIVHNRAVANRRFLSRVNDPGLELGERVVLEPADVGSAMHLLSNAVARTDRAAAEKWDIAQPTPLADLTPGD